MIGLPLDNPLEDALNTLQFNMRHRVTDSWCSIFQPYPRTALGQYCVDHGYTTEDQLRHCSESFFDESRLDIGHKGELFALQKLWYFVIEGDLPLELVQILIRGEFTSHIGDDLQRLRFRCSRKKLYGIDDADPETAVDLKSRERTADPRSLSRECTADLGSLSRGLEPARTTASLVRAALARSPLPDRFIDILASVKFASCEVDHLEKYGRGERAYEPPIYTINDETGELVDPGVSIYIRGTDDPEGNDVRRIPESRFMQGMAEARKALTSANTKGAERHSRSVVQPEPALAGVGAVDNEGEIVVRPDATDRDERYLNQYLA